MVPQPVIALSRIPSLPLSFAFVSISCVSLHLRVSCFILIVSCFVFCVSSFVSPVTSFSFVSAVFLLPSLPFRVFKSSVSLHCQVVCSSTHVCSPLCSWSVVFPRSLLLDLCSVFPQFRFFVGLSPCYFAIVSHVCFGFQLMLCFVVRPDSCLEHLWHTFNPPTVIRPHFTK